MASAEHIRGIAVPAVLNPESIAAFADALDALPESVRMVVLRGDHGVFCKGLDFRWIARSDISDPRDLMSFAGILERLATGPWITVAAVDGAVAGGGMGFVCACDFPVADPAAEFSLPEGMLGFAPGIILPYLLRRMGEMDLEEMVFTGKRFTSTQMLERKVLYGVSEPGGLEELVQRTCREMRSCKAQGIASLKRLLRHAHPHRDDMVKRGVENLLENLATPEVRERLSDLADYLG